MAGLTVDLVETDFLGIGRGRIQSDRTGHGSVSKIDEPNGTITIQQTPDGTVGTSNAASSDFKVQDGLLFNALRAGDKVTFTVDDINGAKTITKLQQE